MAALTEEQSLLRDQATDWVNEQSPVRKFREMRDANTELRYLPQTWQAMVDMGWTGILVPESLGGSGMDYLTFGVVLEQLGRQLVASPLLASSFVGASALLLAGSDAQKSRHLPAVADGSEILTLAVDEGPRHDPRHIALRAERTGEGFSLSGQKVFVPEGMAATCFIVAARTGGEGGSTEGLSLFLVPADTKGITRKALATVDSRGYATVTFDRVRVDAEAVLGEVDNGGLVLDQILDRARAGVASEMLGTATGAFNLTLEYLKTRKQFGRIIGSFQALSHRAAGLFTELELARSCAEGAMQAIDKDAEDCASMCSLAKAKVGDFLHHMSNELIQIHGGIGVTDEFDAGFYLKRARALETLYGNQAFHRDRFARLQGF